MKMTKWLAAGVLALLVAGLLNSIFGLIETPSIPGDNAMKGVDSSSTNPLFEANQDNPMNNLPEADESGLLAAIEAFEASGVVPADLSQLLQAYRTLNRNKYEANPWYLFYEGVGSLLLEDFQTFETISKRLFSMATVTSYHLSWMGRRIDASGYHDYAWMYFERSIRKYVLDGASMDDSNDYISNPFFIPMRSLGELITSGKSLVAMQRINALVKMNPRIENIYWFYLEAARYYASEGGGELTPLFREMAEGQLRDSISFNPGTIVKGDYYLTAMAVTLFMFLVYIVALRFKYHGIVRHARQQASDARKKGRRRFFSWRYSPYYYLRPGEFVFLMAMAVLFLVLSTNTRSIMLSIGRSSNFSINFASGRYDLPGLKQALENLKADYGDTLEFRRFYGYCLAQTGDFDAARNVLEQNLEENSDDISTLVNLAVIEYREGNGGRAGGLIDRAMELEPSCLEVVHNFRVITGQKKEFPDWLQRLEASEDLEATVRIVCENFDVVWPNAMAVISGDTSDTLFMSDRGCFLRLWTKQPMKLRSRMIGALELVRLFVRKNPLLYFMYDVQKWTWFVSFIVTGYFCVIFIRSAGHPEVRKVCRCKECGKMFRGSSENCAPVGLFPDSGGVMLCRECVGNVRCNDDGFLTGKPRRFQLRWIPFVCSFREGRLVTATIPLLLFLYCLVSFVFANSSVLGDHGTAGYLSSIAIWKGTFFPIPQSLSMHNAATYSVIHVSGMAASIFFSIVAARPGKSNEC